ncbi:hypothetical protein AHF37_02854 [Paragonimus kellicotti]|nr:hypothetical protein AHF37_02854 [Paragonimus kellicotti]
MFLCLDDYVERMSAGEARCSNEQPEEHRVGDTQAVPSILSVSECGSEDSRSQTMILLEKKRKRGVWASSTETVLSCSGYSIGLGNFLRFPYLAVSQGGGAFLIPYTMSLFLVGIPLFFMELAIAQFSGLGPLCVFNLVPVFTGKSENIAACVTAIIPCLFLTIILIRGVTLPGAWMGIKFFLIPAWSKLASLQVSNDAACVTAIIPCLLFLTIILIRGVTLPGAWMGIKFFLIPAWSKLASLQIWSQAALQIFFSLGPSWGGIISVASYNKYDHPIMRDSIVLPLIFSLSSIYGGFAIFSVIGNLMYLSGVDSVQTFVRQGHGLAFVTYPEALNHLPGSAIWSALFFAMLFTQGLDTQVSA